MESIGRGRGCARNDENLQTLSQPLLCSDDVNYIDLLNLINFVNDKNVEELNGEIKKFIDEKMNKESLKDISDKLYKHALSHRDFGIKLGWIMGYRIIRNARDSGKSFLHNYFLEQCRIDYARRKELREENIIHFHNAICIFASYIIKSRRTTYHCELFDDMKMLLETRTSEDIQLFMEQIIEHGKMLRYNCSADQDKLMITARQILIKENISVTSRQMLLYAIDLDIRFYTPLPPSLQEFYKPQLDKIVNFVAIKRW